LRSLTVLGGDHSVIVMRGLPGTELLEIAKEEKMVFSSRNEHH